MRSHEEDASLFDRVFHNFFRRHPLRHRFVPAISLGVTRSRNSWSESNEARPSTAVAPPTASVPSIFFFTGTSTVTLKDGTEVQGIDTGSIANLKVRTTSEASTRRQNDRWPSAVLATSVNDVHFMASFCSTLCSAPSSRSPASRINSA